MTKTEIADELDRIKQMVEALDQAVTRLTIAVEKDEEAEKASAKAPAKPKAETKQLKLEDVRAVLTTLSSNKGAGAVKALLKDFGAEKLSDIATQDWPELLAKAEELGQ